MRITDSLVSAFVARANADAKEAIFEASQKVSSGQAISTPSDDPVGAKKSVKLANLLQQLEVFEVAREQVEFDLQLGEVVIAQGVDVLGKMKALAIEMHNGDSSPTDLDAAAQQAQSALDELLKLANIQTDDGQYIFGGTASATPPFDEDGNYLGSDNNRQVQVAPGVVVEGAITGAQSFGTAGEVFQPLQDFVAALEAGDDSGVQDAISELEGSLDFMLVNLSAIGSRGVVLGDVGNIAEELQLQFTVEKSVLTDINFAEEITAYQGAETALAAVVEITGRLMSRSLTAFLGAF